MFSVVMRREPRAEDSAHPIRLPNRSRQRLLATACMLAAATLLAGCVTNNPDWATTGTAHVRGPASAQLAPRTHALRSHAPRIRAAARPAIPLPDAALLKRQPPPDCQLNTEPAGTTPTEVKLATLDYERQCYRQVEGVVRARLDALQDAVGQTIRAVKGGGDVARSAAK